MWDVLLDALIDSLKVLGVSIVIYIIISFIEDKIARALDKSSKLSPLVGSALGLVPQCGIGVVASDLYLKNHISMGTLLAIFISCSDEALPILFTKKESLMVVLPLLAIKFVVGFIVGFLTDLFYHKYKDQVSRHIEKCDHHLDKEVHIGCCGHSIEDEENESFFKHHILHPVIHSLKIFGYVLGINVILGLLLYYLDGEKFITDVLSSAKWFGPLISIFVGVIPNCAASVVITTLYVEGAISFGSCVAGLCMNAGLGLVFLFKSTKNIKNNLLILGIDFFASLIVGYGIDLIMLLF